ITSEASAIYSNEVVLDCPEEPITGVFDVAMIRRVLENIVSNAVKYGDRGAPITIKAENNPENVVISIHNEGNPIPEHKQKEIFKFLNTSNGTGPKKLKSWGMGLTLVKAVAEAHGGYLTLQSNKETGTVFKLVIAKFANKPGKVKTSVIFDYDS
ncbi:sensor histidine kinase, partial [Tamlana crocina]